MRAQIETVYAELDPKLAQRLWDENRGEGLTLELVDNEGGFDIIICNDDEQAIGMMRLSQVNALYLAKSIMTMIELNQMKI